MRYILVSFVWLVNGLATDSNIFEAGMSLVGWLCTVGLMQSWRTHDKKLWGDAVEAAEDLAGENEELERENTELQEKLARYEKTHMAKLLEKSHRKNL